MTSSLRIILPVLGATLVGLALCVALVFGSLDRLFLRTAEANVDFLLTQLRDTIEANVGLGLPLSDIRIVQDLIERAKAADDQVLAVEVFTPDGISVFNTDRGSVGEPVSPAWQVAVRYRVQNERWRIEELGDIVIGQALRNDFGEPVGYLAVTVSGEARGVHAQEVLAGLGLQAAWMAPAVLLVVLLATIGVLDLSGRDMRSIARRLADGSPDHADAALPIALAAGVDGARATLDRAALDFRDAAAEVLLIDENEDRHAG